MALTIVGRNLFVTAITGGGFTPFDHSNSYIGVGNGADAFADSQTDLQGAQKFRKDMEIGYPIVTTNQMVFRSVIEPTDANYAWNEWGVFNDPAGGEMLNRVVEYNGTKLAGQTWVMTATVTVVIGV